MHCERVTRHTRNVGPKGCPEELVCRSLCISETVDSADQGEELLLDLEQGKQVRGVQPVPQVGHLLHHGERAILVGLKEEFTHLRGRGKGRGRREETEWQLVQQQFTVSMGGE